MKPPTPTLRVEEVPWDACSRHNPGRCARCLGPACPSCDYCHGCGRLICRRCDTGTDETPTFAFPGDTHAHPHVVVGRGA